MTAQPEQPAAPEPGPGSGTDRPVPRDLPDQQARPGEDPWEVAPAEAAGDGAAAKDADDVPDPDEAGAGRRGGPDPAVAPSDGPAPEESSG
ncbi:hypothetical protein QQY24_03690 [Streptomyces sp. TG1A-8]|uniref:hypothetical protein n=1 Tax=Streptomyces sp. TG1A-8 TaxID=3051385 RepID=UPI00265B85F2|nr:hypothetical protein [Streptomyces sp. TG1A-8]MDO0924562.1 hypothetical protein [Streptomyces sp. TG1A-8]